MDSNLQQSNQELEMKGFSVSKGIAHGEAFVLLRKELETPVYEIRDSDKPAERKRFEEAIIKTRRDILELKAELSERVGEVEAAIFDAHILVLEDVAVMQETYAMFDEGSYNIEYCYSSVINKFIEAFERIDDSYIKERISDFRDVSRRVLGNLLGVQTSKIGALSDPLILVSSDFTPADFSLVDKSKILAIITEKGSQTSHTAILSRSLGIPCIIGIADIVDKISTGDILLVDGYNGTLIINPSERTVSRYTELETAHKEVQAIYNTSLPSPSVTPDGRGFSVEINISTPSDIVDGAMRYCDGVGLFRTENFFLESGTFPDEESQFVAYRNAALATHGKPLVIRTLDLGGDKNLALMKTVIKEENPFMGYRAIRFCLEHKELFLDQLRAILRASAYGKVKILFPMICSIREVEKAKILVEQAKKELDARSMPYDKNIEIGAMIEVPSAAATVDVIAEVCDFISIGTNDLIQYLLAVDRVNDLVAGLYDPTHPAIIRTINSVVSMALSKNTPVCVCGELAADPIFAPLLLGMGVTEFSMSLKSVSEIKFLLRKVPYAKAKELCNEVLSLSRSRHIVSRLRSFHYEAVKEYLK